MPRAGIEASCLSGVRGGRVRCGRGLRGAAESRFLGAGSGLGGPRGGGQELPLAATRSWNPCAFEMGGAIVTPTFAASSTSSVGAVFLGLVPAILTCGGGGPSDSTVAAGLEEIGVLEGHWFDQIS